MKMTKNLCRCAAALLCLLGSSTSASGITLDVATEGTLEQVVNDSDEPSFKTLVITGRLNAADISYLHNASGRLAGVDTLDLSGVTVVVGGGAYATFTYKDNSDTMDNYSYTFYSSDEPRKEVTVISNMLGGRNYKIDYYSNNLAGAFAQKSYVKVIMPQTMSEVGVMTFYQCSNLTSVELPETVTKVEDCAFQGCTKLTDVNLLNVKEIGSKAFNGCSSLADLDLSDVEKLGTYAFAGCSSFRSTPDSTLNLSRLDTIPERAFAYFPYGNDAAAIKRIVFSPRLKYIGTYAFYSCPMLDCLELPEGLETIDAYGFYNCESLTTVTIPSTLKHLSRNMFKDTPFINNLPAEDGIVYLNTTAIYGRIKTSSDYEVTFREGTTEIGDDFTTGSYNSYITAIHLPSSLQRIGNSAFISCSKITSIELPDGLKEIGSSALAGCSGLVSVNIPNSVEVIGASAFEKCTALETVTLPSSLRSVGTSAFERCTSLGGEVTIPACTEELGSNLFYKTNLFRVIYLAENAKNITNSHIFDAERLTVGAGVRALPYNMFYGESLQKVTFDERTDDAELIIGKACFNGCYNLTSITLPKGRIEIGSSAFLGTGLTSFETLGVVTKICDSQFYGGAFYHTKLKSIEFPDGLTYVGNDTFHRCDSLQTVNLGNSVKYIGEDAFRECKKLTSIQFGNQLDSIGSCAFYYCTTLPSITIPNTTKKIGPSAFASCYDLTEISIPGSVEIIGDNAFYSCYANKIELGEGVKEIGTEVFYGYQLKEFVIPSTVTKLGDNFLKSYIGDYIDSYITEPFEMQERAFDSWTYSYRTLRVPPGTVEAYRNTAAWSKFTNIIELAEDETDYAMTLCDSVCQQGEDITLPLSLVNRDAASGAHFELTLPEGVTIATNEDGSMKAELSDRGQGMSIVAERNPDCYVFDIVSQEDGNGGITGNSGVLLSLTLTVSGDAPVGASSIGITMPSVMTESGRPHYLKPTNAILDITQGTTGITTINANDQSDKPLFDTAGRRITGKPSHGIYIQNGKKIVVNGK